MATTPPPVDVFTESSTPNEGRLMRKVRESPLMAAGGILVANHIIWCGIVLASYHIRSCRLLRMLLLMPSIWAPVENNLQIQGYW